MSVAVAPHKIYESCSERRAELQMSLLSLISIHTFRLSLTLFLVREKYLGRKINIHFLRVPAKKNVASEN